MYKNPHVVDDSNSFSVNTSIFNLQNSHGVNRPGIFAREERDAIKNLENEVNEADFAGKSFLAGQKALITRVVKKPTEIRQGREYLSRSRPAGQR